MSITHGTVTRTAIAQAVAEQASTTGKIVLKSNGTPLVTFTNVSFAAAVNGVIVANSVSPQLAVANGVVDAFEVQTAAGVKIYGGTVTQTGGGGDMTLDNPNVALGQQVSMIELAYNAPV